MGKWVKILLQIIS